MRSYPVWLDLVVLGCSFIYLQLGVCYSGDSAKSLQMQWLDQTVSLASKCKKPTANLVLIYGHSAKALVSLMHTCAVSPEPSLNVANTLSACVKLS